MLDILGLSKEKLEQNGDLEKILNWQKTNLLPIAISMGEITIHTEARLAIGTIDFFLLFERHVPHFVPVFLH